MIARFDEMRERKQLSAVAGSFVRFTDKQSVEGCTYRDQKRFGEVVRIVSDRYVEVRDDRCDSVVLNVVGETPWKPHSDRMVFQVQIEPGWSVAPEEIPKRLEVDMSKVACTKNQEGPLYHVGRCRCLSPKCICEHIPEEHRRDPAKGSARMAYDDSVRPGHASGTVMYAGDDGRIHWTTQVPAVTEKCPRCGAERGCVEFQGAECYDCATRTPSIEEFNAAMDKHAEIFRKYLGALDEEIEEAERFRQPHPSHRKGWNRIFGWPGLV